MAVAPELVTPAAAGGRHGARVERAAALAAPAAPRAGPGAGAGAIGYDPRSPVPPYEQIRAQLARQVQSGELAPGTRLPTVRRLAGDLGLAVNTVARAYRELERDGLVATRGRNGTVVAGVDESRALDAAAEYAARVRALGLPADRALELIRSVLDASEPSPRRAT